MRLVSKFKDFYDFASPYRDSDRRSHYWERHTREEQIDTAKLQKNFNDNQSWVRPKYQGIPPFRTSNGSDRRYGYREEYVVVADQVVSIWCDVDEANRSFDVEREMNPLYSTSPDFQHKSWTTWTGLNKSATENTRPKILKNTFGVILGLQKEYRTPILHLRSTGQHINVTVNPQLLEFGIQHVLDGQQVYQEIEMWFTNQKYDKEEPIPQTDKQKILTHGLDPKTSFRHPIK